MKSYPAYLMILLSLILMGCVPMEKVAKPIEPLTNPIGETLEEVVKEREIEAGGIKSKISPADERQVRIPF